MVAAEERKEPYRSHKVVIRGVVEGYDVASLEDLKKIEGQIESLQNEITALKGQIIELQKALNATNMRLERLENFLRSFK
jgi:predicted RNase H-like nuclease (RuvC/YqgF family)